MAVYNIILGTVIKDQLKNEYKAGWTKTLESARKKAVMTLVENDVIGQIANIYRGDTYCGTVSMQTGPYTYVKPSTGLAKGMQFMYDDGVFHTCFMNGKIKRW